MLTTRLKKKMDIQRQTDKTQDDWNTQSWQIASPAISLPKDGRAIRGIGEKFATNPLSGTEAMTVPIATNSGRSGFGPQISLSYDSGFGNQPFGVGWNISLPSITRRPDKGLPKYSDVQKSDFFILFGSEDLVPILNDDGKRFEDNRTQPGYKIHHFRPRIECIFARIERRTKPDGDIHWRSITKENILTIYGNDKNSQIYDPDEDSQIFSWLISETRDDKGNDIVYKYKPEDGIGVDYSRAHERNRGERNELHRITNCYIKYILL